MISNEAKQLIKKMLEKDTVKVIKYYYCIRDIQLNKF